MKNIYLQITPFFPEPANFRGPYVLDQVRALLAVATNQVFVCKPQAFYKTQASYVYDGIKVHRYPVFEFPSGILPGLFNNLTWWFFKRSLKKWGIDLTDIEVAHAHVTGNGFLVNRLKKKNPKIKTVLQHHGFDVLSLENGILRNVKWHQSWVRQYGISICNKTDLHVGVSQKTLDYLTAIPGIRLKDAYVLYNGVDTAKFYPIPGFQKPDVFTIGCIGNFWPLKDQLTLIKAVEILINKENIPVHLKLVGTGQTRGSCEYYVKMHHLEAVVAFIDEIPHKDLVKFYNSLHLFVLPSYYEAFGCVYTEAYACGVPFIGINGQGIEELIPETDKNNWLFSKGDFNRLAQIIIHYINSYPKQKLEGPTEVISLVQHFINYLKRK